VQRQCLFFIDTLLKNSSNPKYLDITISSCANLLDTHGFSNSFYSETILRILKEMIESKTSENDKRTAIKIMKEHKIKTMILKYLQKRPKKPLWFGFILIAELLRYLIQADNPEADIFLSFLVSPEIQLRRVSVSALKQAETRISHFIESVYQLMLKEENTFVLQSMVQLLGLYGRKPSAQQTVITYVKKFFSIKNNSKQEMVVSIINEVFVEATSNPKSQNISLLISTVNIAGDIGIISPFIVNSLLSLLSHTLISNDDLRTAIHLAFKKLGPVIPAEQLPTIEESLQSLLQSKDQKIREIILKIFRSFSYELTERCKDAILQTLRDTQNNFCLKYALKAIEAMIVSLKKRYVSYFNFTFRKLT